MQVGPKWLLPPLVAVFSPESIRDVLGRNDAFAERCIVHEEVRNMVGDSLFVLPNEPWRPRKRALQPVFTRQNVRAFGGHMSRAAQRFVDAAHGDVDLNERADVIAEHMHVASGYTADRALRPIRATRWLPTPARRRASAAVAAMLAVTAEMLQACRDDPAVTRRWCAR